MLGCQVQRRGNSFISQPAISSPVLELLGCTKNSKVQGVLIPRCVERQW